ncbi:hypothetical protein JAAARDRAFT_460099 [Jaapia argillacea MUCL 33604]|uniref:HMG box domain-containing protein n=1 Tax=Jaapia argillacea MUCL 33604 TaxID=933084 RepID=A0A067Q663_9AGAM|nr:hypothetical protein JAAARDRAFT_460099 [Jaapia argillacea MUCL 33604]
MATSYYSTLDTRPPLEGALLLHLQRIITRYHSPLEIIASEPCQRIQRSWAFDDDVVIKNEDNPWIRQRKRIYLKNRAKNATSAWVPRPPNMFMIFKTVAFVPPADAQAIWRHMSDSEKAPWKEAATMMAAAHSKIFPHYKFCPRTKKETRSVSFRSVSFGSKGGVEKVCNIHLFWFHGIDLFSVAAS